MENSPKNGEFPTVPTAPTARDIDEEKLQKKKTKQNLDIPRNLRGLQPGPINTFPKWKDLGRFVKRGERALTLCMPITRKHRDEDLDEEHTFTSFIYKARWFVLNQTERRELEPITIPEWDAERAITTLRIERVPFDHTDGNCQGFARLCCRQHKRAYVAKSVMWRRVIPFPQIRCPLNFYAT